MAVSDGEPRFMRRRIGILVAIAVVVAVTGAAMVAATRYRDWSDARAQRERIARATTDVRIGMTRAQVETLLGQPTFHEFQPSEMLTPSDEGCKARHRASFIYQAMPEPTLVVFFDQQERVTCVETTRTYVFMQRGS
jgi:hypothetical protein